MHKSIQSASQRLKEKLIRLPVSSLGISAYNQQYLREKIRNMDATMDMYCQLLNFALQDTQAALSDFTLIDYGGGSGIFSLLAKEAGIGQVIYNDIYDVSCADIQRISEYIHIPLNHIVCGDVDHMIDYLHQHSISIDAITSFDVIEHIYAIEDHFEKLAHLQTKPFKLVYGSGANTENPLKVRAITKIHLADEYAYKEKTWGHKERDTVQSFLEVRKNIILSHAPEIEKPKVEQLAKWTRGLMQKDIEKYIDEYLSTGKTGYAIEHPTNTCDPFTGNWSEHLMDLHWLKEFVHRVGFRAEILPGKYTIYGPAVKKYSKYILNGLIQLLKRKGMFLAPYYILVATKQS